MHTCYNMFMALSPLARAAAYGKVAKSLSRPTSSFSADYDILNQELTVYFPNGSVLTYHGIPMTVGLDFENNPSGEKYNTTIKGHYY